MFSDYTLPPRVSTICIFSEILAGRIIAHTGSTKPPGANLIALRFGLKVVASSTTTCIKVGFALFGFAVVEETGKVSTVISASVG